MGPQQFLLKRKKAKKKKGFLPLYKLSLQVQRDTILPPSSQTFSGVYHLRSGCSLVDDFFRMPLDKDCMHFCFL